MSRTRKSSKEELFINELEHSLFMIDFNKIRIIKDFLKDFDEYLKNALTKFKIKFLIGKNRLSKVIIQLLNTILRITQIIIQVLKS